MGLYGEGVPVGVGLRRVAVVVEDGAVAEARRPVHAGTRVVCGSRGAETDGVAAPGTSGPAGRVTGLSSREGEGAALGFETGGRGVDRLLRGAAGLEVARHQVVEVGVAGDEPAAGDQAQGDGVIDPAGLAVAAAAAVVQVMVVTACAWTVAPSPSGASVTAPTVDSALARRELVAERGVPTAHAAGDDLLAGELSPAGQAESAQTGAAGDAGRGSRTQVRGGGVAGLARRRRRRRGVRERKDDEQRQHGRRSRQGGVVHG